MVFIPLSYTKKHQKETKSHVKEWENNEKEQRKKNPFLYRIDKGYMSLRMIQRSSNAGRNNVLRK